MISSWLYPFLLFLTIGQSQLSENYLLYSWNLKDLGKSKSETEINFIAATLKDADIVAIQEVVAGDGGALAVARLAAALNQKQQVWDYVISDPTSSSAYKQERYAFIWKKNKLRKLGRPWLESNYGLAIDREPYFCTFASANDTFTVVNFHAITQSRQPETEIKYFKNLPSQYPQLNLIFCGDWNCPESHSVFNPLKSLGYQAALINQKTSLKQHCNGEDCLASAFDNIFYNTSKVQVKSAGILPFYNFFSSFEEARLVSDHVPVYLEFEMR